MDKENDFEHKSFEIDGRTVEYRTKVVEKIQQDFLNLNAKEQEFIVYCLVDADILLKQMDAEIGISSYSAQDLDDLIYLWLNKQNMFKLVSEEEFINAIGAAFGNCLNREFNTIWTIISDEYGVDYACISEQPKFETYPFSSVWKAVNEKRTNSMQAIIDLVRKHLQDGNFT